MKRKSNLSNRSYDYKSTKNKRSCKQQRKTNERKTKLSNENYTSLVNDFDIEILSKAFMFL